MSAFEKFARPYFQTVDRLCFCVSVSTPNGCVTSYIVRFCYLTRFINSVLKDMPGSNVTVLSKLHYNMPIAAYFVQDLPF